MKAEDQRRRRRFQVIGCVYTNGTGIFDCFGRAFARGELADSCIEMSVTMQDHSGVVGNEVGPKTGGGGCEARRSRRPRGSLPSRPPPSRSRIPLSPSLLYSRTLFSPGQSYPLKPDNVLDLPWPLSTPTDVCSSSWSANIFPRVCSILLEESSRSPTGLEYGHNMRRHPWAVLGSTGAAEERRDGPGDELHLHGTYVLLSVLRTSRLNATS